MKTYRPFITLLLVAFSSKDTQGSAVRFDNDIEATTAGSLQDETTIFITRYKREVIPSDLKQSATEIVTEPALDDEALSYTTVGSREKRDVSEVTETSFSDETTIESRIKRDVGEVTEGNFDDGTTVGSRVKREVTTDSYQNDEEDSAQTTLSPRNRREVFTTEEPTLDDDSELGTTISPRFRREAPTYAPTADNLISATQIYDDISETTIVSREKREVSLESMTESVSVNEISNQEQTVIATPLIQFDDSDQDVDVGFKYPTTPHPDPDNTTSLPLTPNDAVVPADFIKQVNGQKIIVGNRTCTCGTALTKIIGGAPSRISDLPWTVALVRKSNRTLRGPYCGGTLISDRYIATASHCVDGQNASRLEVWLNEEDFREENENLNGTLRIDVEEIIMHPEYNRKKIDNDIALLRLAEPVDIEGIFRPVCIPADETKTYEDEEGIVAGWGATEEGGSVSATLQKVPVPILRNKVCNWRTLYLGQITDNQLCAGELASGGKDSCQGDSGGPLIVKRGENSAQSILAGIVSWGYGCARPLAPGVYTRVANYHNWIFEQSAGAEYCQA